MKLTESLVSIVVTSYNAEQTLRQCLDSLLTQSYFPIEIILIDDASRDSTYKIAREYKKLDSRVRIYKNKKRYGPSVCFNRGLKRAKGQFISFMNAHDFASRHKLKSQISFLLKNPKVVAVGTQVSFLNEQSKKIKQSMYPSNHQEIYQKMLHGTPMRFETAVINRSLLPKDILKFTTNTYPFIYSGVFMRMMQYGKLANLKTTLYFHRQIAKPTYKTQKKSAFLASFLSQLVQSFYDHQYRPSFTTFFQTIITSVKGIPLPRPRLFPPFRSV